MKKKSLLLSTIFFSLQAIAQNYAVELVTDLNLVGGSNPRWFTVWDTTLYYLGSDGINGHKIFSMTPSTLPTLCSNVGGTSVFGDGSISTNRPMGLLNNQLYFPEFASGVGRELHRYDGSNTPSMVMDIDPGSGSSGPNFLLVHNNKLYFQASSPTIGNELWVHDPIANTTTSLTDINPGAGNSFISFITAYNNKLYFAGSNGNTNIAGNTGAELYCFDPANNTTSLVADINPGYLSSNPSALMVANNKLYFAAEETQYGRELYDYDGNAVTRLTDINPGPANGVYTSDHSFPVWLNGKIYLAANDTANLINLGVFDPQTNTTNIIYCSGPTQSGTPRYFTVWDNRVFFTNLDTAHGYEIWAADGINAPALVWDVRPGTGSSLPKFYTSYAGALYFNAANDTSTAEELFRLKKLDTGEPSGIGTPSRSYDILISPNPAQRQFHILSRSLQGQNLTLCLYNLAGTCILQQGIRTNQNIHLNQVPAGMYLITVKNENGERVYEGKLGVY